MPFESGVSSGLSRGRQVPDFGGRIGIETVAIFPRWSSSNPTITVLLTSTSNPQTRLKISRTRGTFPDHRHEPENGSVPGKTDLDLIARPRCLGPAKAISLYFIGARRPSPRAIRGLLYVRAPSAVDRGRDAYERVLSQYRRVALYQWQAALSRPHVDPITERVEGIICMHQNLILVTLAGWRGI